jgi:uncharacterized protein
MLKVQMKIKGIPAILWGEPAERLMIAVHGAMSSKDDHEILAEEAAAKGFQVLSFDLPEHGERKAEEDACTPPNAVRDLLAVMAYAKTISSRISLFACSLGAYFSLLAYADQTIEQCLFLSPLLDMHHLIQNMMAALNVSEERLETEKVIENPYGPKLDWEYYCYVKAHPIERWDPPTSILYGSADNVTEIEVVNNFVKRFQCSLQVLEGGEHYFHTEDQLRVFREWLRGCLSSPLN